MYTKIKYIAQKRKISFCYSFLVLPLRGVVGLTLAEPLPPPLLVGD